MAPSTSVVAILQQIQHQIAANQKLHQHQTQQEQPSLFISCCPPTSVDVGAPSAQATYLNRVYSPIASSCNQQNNLADPLITFSISIREPANLHTQIRVITHQLWTSTRQNVAQDKATAGSSFSIFLEADEESRSSGLHCQISIKIPPSTCLIYFIQATCQDIAGSSTNLSKNKISKPRPWEQDPVKKNPSSICLRA
ncbi:hypothetical protein Nepgr_020735 [Nepenthes gracilis]|uniref:Uncharacterized protein n=1 Tax=Nepenthes gracilis TaxID=150966 RepID=A0AAD3SXH1_NEPGR|nr:hypothetical protein Nepgr_020735 [Nepenthes gracilis]